MRRCGVCDMSEDNHAAVMHEFVDDDVLIPKQVKQSSKVDTSQVSQSRPDVILRLFLMQSGIIDAGELQQFEEVIRHAAASAPRQREGAEGDSGNRGEAPTE